jgi:hypothetical protein
VNAPLLAFKELRAAAKYTTLLIQSLGSGVMASLSACPHTATSAIVTATVTRRHEAIMMRD